MFKGLRQTDLLILNAQENQPLGASHLSLSPTGAVGCMEIAPGQRGSAALDSLPLGGLSSPCGTDHNADLGRSEGDREETRSVHLTGAGESEGGTLGSTEFGCIQGVPC